MSGSEENGFGQLPPSGGAVDLGSLRQQLEHAEQIAVAQQQAILKFLTDNGLVCSCGERVRTQGVMLFGCSTGPVATPQGPQPGVRLIIKAYHSRKCPDLQEVLNAAPEELEAQPLAIRSIPAVEWLDQK